MVNEKNVACKKMYGDTKRENIIWKNKTKQNKTKTVNRSCQYEVMGTFRKRNNPSRQIFVPDL